MLTPLQQRIGEVVAGLAEAEGFALAGGGAVILQGVVDRLTDDLDFFGPDAAGVAGLASALRSALELAGLSVETVIDNVGFVRLEVSSPGEVTSIDLGTDARLRPVDRFAVGDVLSVEELGADKLLALFSRAQARDFVDVAALAERLGGLDRLCQLAAEKDPGFSRGVLLDMLGGFARFTPADFPGGQAQQVQLAQTVERWRLALRMGQSRPPPRGGRGR